MNRLAILVFLLVCIEVNAQELTVMKFPELQKKIMTADAPLTVFNFWATWCGPCVKEMPHFESYVNDPDVKVYFVSLDFVDDIDKVRKFVVNKKLETDVIFLNEPDYDSYIPKVSKEWTGAIPATLFVDEWGKTYFHENEFTKEDLDKTIDKYLN